MNISDWFENYTFDTVDNYFDTYIVEFYKDGHITRILPFQPDKDDPELDKIQVGTFARENCRPDEHYQYSELMFWLMDLVVRDGDPL